MKSATRLSLLSILAAAIAFASAMALASDPRRRGQRQGILVGTPREALQDLLAKQPEGECHSQPVGRSPRLSEHRKKSRLHCCRAGGTGALLRGNRTLGYFQTVGGSYGFQAGIQAYGYALFFLDRQIFAISKRRPRLERQQRPESRNREHRRLGVPWSTLNLKKGIVAVFFNQRGLMGGLGLQGTKISQFTPDY